MKTIKNISKQPYQLLIFTLFLLILPLNSSATDLSLEGYSEITAPEVKVMIDNGRPVLIVNVLSELEYDIQHISGSINIPIDEMLTTTKLPEDQDTPLVFHCLSER